MYELHIHVVVYDRMSYRLYNSGKRARSYCSLITVRKCSARPLNAIVIFAASFHLSERGVRYQSSPVSSQDYVKYQYSSFK